MNNIIVAGVLGTITSLISSILTFTYTKRKYNSEVENNEIINMKESISLYTTLLNDIKKRLEDIINENDLLRTQIQELILERSKLKEEVVILSTQVKTLTKELKLLNKNTL